MADIDKKVVKMKQKSDEVRSVFNLPDTEPVIQDYSCSFSHKPGRMYITANYCLWLPTIGSEGLQIPFRKFKNVKKDKNLFFDNSITVENDEGQSYFFATFNHRDETINLLQYLWQNPPSYIEIEEEDILPFRSNPSSKGNNSSSIVRGGNSTTSQQQDNWARDENSISSNGNSNNNSGQRQSVTVKVDTDSSKNALRLVSQARDMGTATLAELTIQAEQIDRIENNVERIHSELDKSNKLLRGIESLPGAISNAMSKDTKSFNAEYKDRSLEIKYKEQSVDYDILEKLPNDHLQPAILRFVEDKFMVVDPIKKVATNKDQIWNFDKIEEIVMRARHQHLDIRFQGKANRFRICSSYLQGIVNEIVLRAKPHPIRVVFEPGTRKFQYGDPAFCKVPIKTRKDVASGNSSSGGGNNAFSRRANPNSNIQKLVKDAPDDIKEGIKQQEQDLDDISDILTDITAIAETMGSELDRQSEQLDRVTGRVDSANEKLYQTNRRIDKLL